MSKTIGAYLWQRRALRDDKHVRSSPKADNTLDRHCLQKRLFVGEDPFAICLSALGPKDPHGFVLCKRREQFFRLIPTSKKDASHSCLISLS